MIVWLPMSTAWPGPVIRSLQKSMASLGQSTNTCGVSPGAVEELPESISPHSWTGMMKWLAFVRHVVEDRQDVLLDPRVHALLERHPLDVVGGTDQIEVVVGLSSRTMPRLISDPPKELNSVSR
jgi:hypothetical protein